MNLSMALATAAVTAGLTPSGLNLQERPALLIAIIVAYFFIGRRFADGTMWARLFNLARPLSP